MIKGRKRWVLRPPDAGSSRNGQPGTEPPGVMQRWGEHGLCSPSNKPTDALHCDQLEGDVIWYAPQQCGRASTPVIATSLSLS